MTHTNRNTEHVMLYGDIQSTIRNHTEYLIIANANMALLRGKMHHPDAGVYDVQIVDAVSQQEGHTYFLNFGEEDIPDTTILLSVDRDSTRLFGQEEPVDDEVILIARFMVNNAVWIDTRG